MVGDGGGRVRCVHDIRGEIGYVSEVFICFSIALRCRPSRKKCISTVVHSTFHVMKEKGARQIHSHSTQQPRFTKLSSTTTKRTLHIIIKKGQSPTHSDATTSNMKTKRNPWFNSLHLFGSPLTTSPAAYLILRDWIVTDQLPRLTMKVSLKFIYKSCGKETPVSSH